MNTKVIVICTIILAIFLNYISESILGQLEEVYAYNHDIKFNIINYDEYANIGFEEEPSANWYKIEERYESVIRICDVLKIISYILYGLSILTILIFITKKIIQRVEKKSHHS